MSSRFLLIEDDAETAHLVLKGLEAEGYTVDWENDGYKGLHRYLTNKYDFVITDINLPVINGFELVRKMQEHNSDTPIIVLSGKTSCEDRVQGLSQGAEDYLCKPFSMSELQIRIKNILRAHDAPTVISYGDVKLDRIKRTLVRGKMKYEILEREFQLLDLLITHADKVISKEQILRDICGYNFTPNTNIVDVLICRLRDKISCDNSMVSIRTIRGVGYKIHMDPAGMNP